MNTKEFMPFESVVPIMITNKEYPEYPFFEGTGFFAKFDPYDEIFLSRQGIAHMIPTTNQKVG